MAMAKRGAHNGISCLSQCCDAGSSELQTPKHLDFYTQPDGDHVFMKIVSCKHNIKVYL